MGQRQYHHTYSAEAVAIKTELHGWLQAYNEEDAAHEGLPEGEERMEILEQQAQPTNRPRITTRYMTKYERARILGTRALQIR